MRAMRFCRNCGEDEHLTWRWCRDCWRMVGKTLLTILVATTVRWALQAVFGEVP